MVLKLVSILHVVLALVMKDTGIISKGVVESSFEVKESWGGQARDRGVPAWKLREAIF